MKLSVKNNILMISKIVLPAFLCVVLIYFFKVYESFKYILLYLNILTFGIVIILFNKEKTKHDFILSFLFSAVLCFLVLFLSMGVSSAIQYFINDIIGFKIKEGVYILAMQTNDLYALIAIGIISPILMFYCYRVLFKIKKTNYFIIVKWVSVFILIVLGLSNVLFEDEKYFMLWQFIMALALQLILYQKELKTLLKLKKID